MMKKTDLAKATKLFIIAVIVVMAFTGIAIVVFVLLVKRILLVAG